MADKVSLGELVVQISMDTKQLVEGQKKAEQALGQTAKASDKAHRDIEANVKRMTVAFIAAGVAAAAMFSRAATGAAQLDKLSQSTGISIATLSELKYAAGQVGVEFSDVEQVIRGWNATVVEMSQNVQSRASIALRTLGLDAKEIASLPFDQVLRRVNDALGQYADGQNKASLATAIFKDGAAQIAPLLNANSAELDRLAQRARDLGLTMSKDNVTAAKEYQAAMAELGMQMEKFALQIGGPILKNLNALAQAMGDAWNFLREKTKETLVITAQKEFEQLTMQAQLLSEGLEENGQDWENFGEKATDTLARVNARLAENLKLRQELGMVEGPKRLQGTMDVPMSKPEAPGMPNMGNMRQELDAFIDRLSGLPVLMGESFAFDDRPFLEAMGRVNEAVRNNVMTSQEASRLKLTLQRNEQNAILETAQVAAQTLTTVFGKSKAAAIGAALINTSVAVTRALSAGPPPWNFAQAALVAAAGAAQIAQIRSTSQSGGGGGAAMSGGGGGSPDTGEGGGGSSRTIFVENINSTQLYSGAAVRELMERIAEEQRDGAQLVFKGDTP